MTGRYLNNSYIYSKYKTLILKKVIFSILFHKDMSWICLNLFNFSFSSIRKLHDDAFKQGHKIKYVRDKWIQLICNYGTDRMVATNKYFEHFYPKMPSFIRFWNHWDHQFWMWKRAFEVYSTTDISKTVCQVVNVFPLIQSVYKWLSAEEIWKARTAYFLRKWICKNALCGTFWLQFQIFRGSKNDVPLSRFF